MAGTVTETRVDTAGRRVFSLAEKRQVVAEYAAADDQTERGKVPSNPYITIPGNRRKHIDTYRFTAPLGVTEQHPYSSATTSASAG